MHRWVLVVLAVASGLVACGGGGGGGGGDPDDGDLVVVKFALLDRSEHPMGGQGTTNAYRNNVVRLVFSARVEPASVISRTVRIATPSLEGLSTEAVGRYTVDGNEVLFDPSVTATGAPHPLGFEANTSYEVTVAAVPDAATVRSTTGEPVLSAFRTTFATADLWLPDGDPPRVLDVSPEPEATEVDSRADVRVEFSEPMDPGTFDLHSTFREGDLGGVREVVLDYAREVLTVKGKELDLGAFVEGANAVYVGVEVGGEGSGVLVRMARSGSSLRY